MFNARGFACSDAVRWEIWNDDRIEPWYRQNMMLVTRDEDRAGSEERIDPVVHPAMLDIYSWDRVEQERAQIGGGSLPWSWYLSAPFKAAAGKVRRRSRGR